MLAWRAMRLGWPGGFGGRTADRHLAERDMYEVKGEARDFTEVDGRYA